MQFENIAKVLSAESAQIAADIILDDDELLVEEENSLFLSAIEAGIVTEDQSQLFLEKSNAQERVEWLEARAAEAVADKTTGVVDANVVWCNHWPKLACSHCAAASASRSSNLCEVPRRSRCGLCGNSIADDASSEAGTPVDSKSEAIIEAVEKAIGEVRLAARVAGVSPIGFQIDENFCDWNEIHTDNVVVFIDAGAAMFGAVGSSEYISAAREICDRVCAVFEPV